MPANLSKPFDESCCDGGSSSDATLSAQPCGCDLRAGWVCERHQTPSVASEIRVTDPTTGGQKGTKLARFSLIPPDFLWALAEHYGKGARKYDDRNWERGYKWSLTTDALERHYRQWLLGEDTDAETGTSHLIAMAWHVIALWWFHRHGKGTDDVRRTS